TAPTFLRTISGPTRPAVAAWGIAYNPLTDEFEVSDQISNQIRRFTRSGQYVGDFDNPGAIISGLAVDKRDGSVYAGATNRNPPYNVLKYDKSGHFLWGFNLPNRVAWLTVDDAGYLWFPWAYGSYQVNKYSVDDSTHTVHQLLVLGTNGSGLGQARFDNGVDVASSGDVYVADSLNRRVHVYSNSGSWKFDIGDNTVFTGDLRGLVVDDANSRLYVADAKGGQIEEFTLSGTHLLTIGSEG